MNKPMALYLCRELEGALAPRQSHGLPVHIKVLVAVKFMAGGSYQREVGQDHTLCVAQRTASKYLTQVIAAINRSLKPKWITFPGNERERRDVAAAFEAKYGLPDLLGTLDCTHVSIFPPPRPHGLQYINRKGKHTINVQLIADVNCRLLHVNAQYPGRRFRLWIGAMAYDSNTPRCAGVCGGALHDMALQCPQHHRADQRLFKRDTAMPWVEMGEVDAELPVDHHRPEPIPQAALYQAAVLKRGQIINTYFN
ncbi:putative nuclease HARBI1 [Leguminivora glycinivorella]|uniref:putative nuclease HARBI1 n=1 Tax=Leguminivora glycinivorella TaxID=1035111 RepID=UPI00200D9B06|nr:putative nuclease HARBI1 [Leguminivora glycinivorella]